MEKEFGTDPEKMLDWDKKLGEQSEFVIKAIDPLLTWDWAYKKDTILNSPIETGNIDDRDYWKKHFNEDPNDVKKYILDNCDVEDLFNRIAGHTAFSDNNYRFSLHRSKDEIIVVSHLKSLGIEGTRFDDGVDTYDNLPEIKQEKENNMSEKFEWNEVTPWDFGGEWEGTTCLTTYVVDKDNPSYFMLESANNDLVIGFFVDDSDVLDHKPIFYIDTKNLDIDTAKNIIEKTTEHFSKLKNYKFNDMKDHIIKQFPEQTVILKEYPKNKQASDRQLETAQKTGYVQGVCESVLAFNTDENRKIMSEDTMSFLSKKILSEMHVTKDMAQKFANPETYKALEQCVFAPKQEQQLEQTQSQGIGR